MIGMRGQAGIVYFLDRGVLVKKAANRQRICFVLAHTHRQRLDAAQREPAIEGARYASGSVLIELDGLVDFLIAGDESAANDIAMAVDVLGRAMHHDIRAQFQWLLELGT